MSADDPIVQKGEYKPGVAITARMTPSWSSNNDEGTQLSLFSRVGFHAADQAPRADVLAVRFHGGYYVDQPQFASIHFVCEPNHDNVRRPLPL